MGQARGPPLTLSICASSKSSAECKVQTIVNKAKDQGTLKLPINRVGSNFPIVQYVDETLLIMEACPVQLVALKEILHAFALSTGLRVNYVKTVMVPNMFKKPRWIYRQITSTIKKEPSHSPI